MKLLILLSEIVNCANYDARHTTLANNVELREKTAATWKVQFGADITPEMINCTGCREEGMKFAHCSEWEIRKCADNKGFKTCASCNMLDTCDTMKNLHQYLPEALTNLKNLN